MTLTTLNLTLTDPTTLQQSLNETENFPKWDLNLNYRDHGQHAITVATELYTKLRHYNAYSI